MFSRSCVYKYGISRVNEYISVGAANSLDCRTGDTLVFHKLQNSAVFKMAQNCASISDESHTSSTRWDQKQLNFLINILSLWSKELQGRHSSSDLSENPASKMFFTN